MAYARREDTGVDLTWRERRTEWISLMVVHVGMAVSITELAAR
jgi:hypothetical protein